MTTPLVSDEQIIQRLKDLTYPKSVTFWVRNLYEAQLAEAERKLTESEAKRAALREALKFYDGCITNPDESEKHREFDYGVKAEKALATDGAQANVREAWQWERPKGRPRLVCDGIDDVDQAIALGGGTKRRVFVVELGGCGD